MVYSVIQRRTRAMKQKDIQRYMTTKFINKNIQKEQQNGLAN